MKAAAQLRDDGFCILPGPVPAAALGALANAYDRAMAGADPIDRREGRTTVRVHDFVNRGPEFDPIYVYPPLLDACAETLPRPFRLSTMHARTLLPGKPAQDLHVDYAPDALGWTMIGFILMIDPFSAANGGTRFLKGSHLRPAIDATGAGLTAACGPAGSMIVYNGAILHGHGANSTHLPRRSIQGSFIRRNSAPFIDFCSRMTPDTLRRIGPLAKFLLAV